MMEILLVLALTALVVVGFVFYTLKNLLLVSAPSEALILSLMSGSKTCACGAFLNSGSARSARSSAGGCAIEETVTPALNQAWFEVFSRSRRTR